MILTITASGWAGENTEFTFNGTNGANPGRTMVMDSAGNLYGIASFSGGSCTTSACGMIFKLTPTGPNHWRESIVHRFTGADDGRGFIFLTMGPDGNLYGTTSNGGGLGGQCNNGTGCGTVFQIMTSGSEFWPEHILYRFNGRDGAFPNGLAFDSEGNLYGTAGNGGGGTFNACSSTGCGVIFQLTPTTSGSWTLVTLHLSLDAIGDATAPVGLIVGSGGTIYGMSSAGGHNGVGSIFQLVPGAGGWSFSIIHSFGQVPDGAFPNTAPILDSEGNLYGTTSEGGGDAASGGIAFELSPDTDGTWTENILYHFNFGAVGYEPDSPLVFDTAGNLYGAADYGGSKACTPSCGTIFKLTPSGSGTWTASAAIRFEETNGAFPVGGLVADTSGNLYGTASAGGASNDGLVFKLVP